MDKNSAYQGDREPSHATHGRTGRDQGIYTRLDTSGISYP